MKYLFTILLFCGTMAAQCTGSGTTWSCPAGTTPAQVNTMIGSATDGATATFANGSYTWGGAQIAYSSTKAMTLICATVGGCNVTSTAGRTFNLPSASSTKLYRFSGFAVNLGTTNQLLWACPGGGCTNVITQLRIDHNTLTNTNANGAITPDILTIGENTAKQYVYGVIDHNTVNCTVSCYFMEWINATATFDPAPPAPPLGTINNLFFEDNTVTIANMTNNGTGCVDHWGGSAVVFRHNAVTNCRIISHGVLHGGGPSNFEISDNTITWTSTSGVESGGFRSLHHQGSNTFIAFNNRINPFSAHDGDPAAFLHYRSWTAGSLCDGTNGGGFPDGNRAPTGTNHGYPCFRQPGRDVTGAYKPMYFWGNKWGDDNTKFDVGYDDTGGAQDFSTSQIINNREYFNAVSANAQSTSSSPFNGTTGMGFGTLANRPTTCTTSSEAAFGGAAGVGYFATDQGTQGVLYTCSATNTWAVYYTPFTYPHPLQGASPAPLVQLSPTSLTFGPQAVGTTSANQSVTLTNVGTATLNIASIVVGGSGPSAAFINTGNTCGSTLAISASCTITVAFNPQATGVISGFISIVDNAFGSPHSVALSGTGQPTSATLTPNPLAFGRHAVGSSIPMLATLTNTGSGVLTLNCGGCGFGLAGSSFAFTSTTCGTQLGPLQTCTMTITFNPSSLGSVSGTLTATNDASSSPQVITLTGIGGTAHYIIGKPGGGTGWGKIGKIPSPPNPPTSYSARIDNCVTGTEVAIGTTPGCIAAATTGKAGSPMSFRYRPTDTNLFTDNAPANTAATDPDFGSYVVLATDQTIMNTCSPSGSCSFNMGSNGEYDGFNKDSTMLLIGKNGGATGIFKVDTAAIHAKTCTPGAPCVTLSGIQTGAADCTGGTGNPTTGTTCTHLLQQGDWTFSRKTGEDSILYEEDPTLSKIYKLTINAGRTSFQRDVYIDFASDTAGNCSVLPSNYTVGWSGVFASGNDGSITKGYGGGVPWPGTSQPVNSTETFIYPTVNNAGHRGFQATSTGTTNGSAEPNWNSTCNTVGQTCTDGTVAWTNIGNLSAQGPGFDVVNYRPGKGCSRLNTRTGRITRGTGNIEPAGLLTTQDDTICTRMTGAACPAGPPLGTVSLTDRFTLHEAGQPFDSRFISMSATGAGAVEAGTTVGAASCSQPSANNKGTWSSLTTYANNDLVYFNHVIYVSNTTNTNKQPDINTTDWSLGDALCYTYVWQVASTVMNPCIEIGASTGVGACSGHSEKGYGYFYKGTKLQSHRWDLPSIAGNANPGKVVIQNPIGSADHHASGRNEDSTDTLPFLFFTTEVPTSTLHYETSSTCSGSPCAAAGYAEDVGISPDGTQKTFRFNHNYNTGSSAEFAIQNAIGVISQDGKFAAFGSDWMGSRGDRISGGATCNKLRADDGPVKGATIATGFQILPVTNNTGQDIYQAQAPGGVTSPTTTPNWNTSCPNVNNTCVDGGVTWKNLGPNSCRGDIAVVDLLSAHPLP